jgi:hypothetical protein
LQLISFEWMNELKIFIKRHKAFSSPKKKEKKEWANDRLLCSLCLFYRKFLSHAGTTNDRHSQLYLFLFSLVRIKNCLKRECIHDSLGKYKELAYRFIFTTDVNHYCHESHVNDLLWMKFRFNVNEIVQRDYLMCAIEFFSTILSYWPNIEIVKKHAVIIHPEMQHLHK